MIDVPARRYKTADDHIYHQVKRWIMDGTLKPGERIEQEWLAKRLDASRMPVRTAIARLAAEHLVAIEAHKGAMVKPLSAIEVDDLYSVRIRLEPWAVELAGPNITPAQIARAQALVDAGETCVRRRRWQEYLQTNHDFYEIFFLAAGNGVLHDTIHQLFDRALRYRWLYVAGDGKQALDTSRQLAEFVSQKQYSQAAGCLTKSLIAAKVRLVDLISAQHSPSA